MSKTHLLERLQRLYNNLHELQEEAAACEAYGRPDSDDPRVAMNEGREGAFTEVLEALETIIKEGSGHG